jgi:hypothetical protein
MVLMLGLTVDVCSGFFGAQGLLGTVLTAARSGFDQTSAGSQMLKTVRERVRPSHHYV